MPDPTRQGLSQAAFARAKAGWKPWENHGPKLLLTGEPAVRAAGQIVSTATTVVVTSATGPVVLVPGTVLGDDKILLAAHTMTVTWAAGDHIYEWGTQEFIRCEWIDAMADGAKKAMAMRRLAKIEMELLAGLFVPFYLVLGVTVAKCAVFYTAHQRAFELIRSHLSDLAGQASLERAPTTW